MSAAAPVSRTDLDVLRHQARLVRQVVGVNLDGVTNVESLRQPQPGGNCLNWVLGHLLWTYEGALPLLGRSSVLQKGAVERYRRGGPPLRDSAEAVEFDTLRKAWEQAAERVEAGLAELRPEALDRPAPFSPSNDPDETVGSLLATLVFHQSYHAGQTGVLRRIAGREGAIR